MRVVPAFGGRRLVFDPARLRLDVPETAARMGEAVVPGEPGESAGVGDLVAWVRAGLEGPEPRFLSVAWRARVAEGQEVFPSQEYLREAKREDAPSRVSAKLARSAGERSVMQASLHSQKIGAALRHIDSWHGDPDHGAIAVNPYGGVQESGQVLRGRGATTPSGAKSFYELRARPEALLEGLRGAEADPRDIPPDVHFLVANLVRGGVFGQKADG